ncbi:MAG: hypothetical protein GX895_04685, partial [Clostridiales bacterium]|nr:hypothetical protein [Clostridiales bacterium]
NTMVTILLIIFGALLVGAAAFGGYMLASKASNNNVVKQDEQQEVKEESFYSAGEFTVNLANTNARKYLKTTVVLAYDIKNEELTEELTKKTDAVRDCIISVLRTKKAEELQTATGPEELKNEIITRVNSILSKGRLSSIYYKEFVIQ